MPENEPLAPNKTKTAVIEAFNVLVLKDRYDAIRVGDIVRDSDVGRSTFYEHFRDKDDVLRQSMAGILTILSRAVEADPDVNAIRGILDHFRKNERLAREMFNGPTIAVMVGAFAKQIEDRLSKEKDYALPKPLIAGQIAESATGLIRGWLSKNCDVSAEQLAGALATSARTLKQAYEAVETPTTSR